MNSASTSTASLLPTTQSSPKNYQRAFGNLSSAFGFGGSVVSAPTLSSASSNSSLQGKSQTSQRQTSSPSAAQQSQAAYWASQSHKNFEAAYGNLASTYGFGGGVPSPKARKV